jgi:hypothetical protein
MMTYFHKTNTSYSLKQVSTLILVLVLFIGLFPVILQTANAANTLPTSMSQGETLTITYSINGTLVQTTGSAEFIALYNADSFEFVSAVIAPAALTNTIPSGSDEPRVEYAETEEEDGDDLAGDFSLSFSSPYLVYANTAASDGDTFVLSGTFYTVVLRAKSNIANVSDEVGVAMILNGDFEQNSLQSVDYDVTAGAPAAPYTATASGDATATVGTNFDVAVTLTADPVTNEYAQAQVKLTYDATKVTPDLTGVSNVSGSGGILTITGGSGADVAVGSGVTLATIPFEPILTGTATFSVSEGAAVSFITKAGGATADISAGTDLNVAISAAVVTYDFDTTFKGLPSSGYQLLMKEISQADADKVWTYDGANMHNIYKNSKYYATYIVEDTIISSTAETPVKTETPYAKSANLDGVGAVDISDSQIAFDLANSYSGYTGDSDFTALSIAVRLAADVNGDGVIDTADATGIIYAIHHGGELAA